MPIGTRAHCLVSINATHMLMAGGKSGGVARRKDAWILNWISKVWSRVPDMNVPRSSHICQLLPNKRLMVAWGKSAWDTSDVS